MDPFTIVLIVAGVLVLAYALWTFVRPSRGRFISTNAPAENEAANMARIINQIGGERGPGGGGGGF